MKAGKMLVGLCPNHGLVKEDSIVDKLPAKCKCKKCQLELDRVTVTDRHNEVLELNNEN